jgi:hypothetical protein
MLKQGLGAGQLTADLTSIDPVIRGFTQSGNGVGPGSGSQMTPHSNPIGVGFSSLEKDGKLEVKDLLPDQPSHLPKH